MIKYEKAKDLVIENVGMIKTGTEKIKTSKSLGRVLASDVKSLVSSPPFDKAAMDGFAARSQDIKNLPTYLRVVGSVPAGGFPDFAVGEGECAEISTGAPVPEGADTVIMVEKTKRVNENKVKVQKPASGNICMEGEDVEKGEVVLKKNEKLNSLKIGLAASAGYKKITVYKKPAASLLCTGSEVREPGQELKKGQIYNANGPMLSSLLYPFIDRLNYLGTVGDKIDTLEEKIKTGLADNLFLISGGVSVGEHDLVPEILQDLRVEKIFHKWAVKPGKPTFFGVKDKTIVFAMPGNPQSCFVVFKLLVEPAILQMTGAKETLPKFKVGKADENFVDKSSRRHFIPCQVNSEGGINNIKRAPYNGSADIRGPSSGDGFLTIPPKMDRVEKGQPLEFFEI